MRGADEQQSQIFSYLSPEARVRKDHPLRAIRAMVDEVLARLSPQFDAMYASVGRPSIAPEKLLRAQLLQMLYSIRSERLLMEEMDYNLLFRWFVGLNADDAVWDATVFTKNRDRLLEADVAKLFLAQVVEQARVRGLTSDEHFTVDGTLLEAWASVKSFQPKAEKKSPPDDGDNDPGNPTVNFHGEKRSNDTHASTTDPESLLARKGGGKEAKLSYSGHLLVENRNGLIVDAEGLQANGTAERDRAADAGESSGHPVGDGGRGQGIRYARVCGGVPASAGDAARGAEPCATGRQRHRRAHHAARGIPDQPEEEEANRGMFRLAEDGGGAAEGAPSRSCESGLDFYLRLRRLQPGAHAQSGGRSSGGVGRGRSVSAGPGIAGKGCDKTLFARRRHHSR